MPKYNSLVINFIVNNIGYFVILEYAYIVANGRSYVACGLENAGLPVMVAAKPNFIILILNCLAKSQILKFGDGRTRDFLPST